MAVKGDSIERFTGPTPLSATPWAQDAVQSEQATRSVTRTRQMARRSMAPPVPLPSTAAAGSEICYPPGNFSCWAEIRFAGSAGYISYINRIGCHGPQREEISPSTPWQACCERAYRGRIVQ